MELQQLLSLQRAAAASSAATNQSLSDLVIDFTKDCVPSAFMRCVSLCPARVPSRLPLTGLV